MCNFVQFLCLLLQFGVGETGMVDSLELLDEYRLGIGDVTEGDGTFFEIALSHLSVDEAVDEFADGLLRVVGKGAGGGFDGVCHHEDSLFLGEGVGTWIGEEQFVDVVVGVGILVLYVEILRLALTVVGGDEVADD